MTNLSPAGFALFAADFLVILVTGAAGFGINEMVRRALRNGVTPVWRAGDSAVSRDTEPKLFGERMTKWVIAGNLLLVCCAANAVALGLLLFYLSS